MVERAVKLNVKTDFTIHFTLSSTTFIKVWPKQDPLPFKDIKNFPQNTPVIRPLLHQQLGRGKYFLQKSSSLVITGKLAVAGKVDLFYKKAISFSIIYLLFNVLRTCELSLRPYVLKQICQEL